jgi:hypothetical protein
VGEPVTQPVSALRRTWTAGGLRAAIGASYPVFLLGILGVVLVVMAFRETTPRHAAFLSLLGVAVMGLVAVNYACVLLARVEVDGDLLKVRGPSGTVAIRAGEIAGFRRDGATAVLLLRRPDRKRLRLPARVALDEEFFGWLAAHSVSDPDDTLGPCDGS